jgi:hypothetical protein
LSTAPFVFFVIPRPPTLRSFQGTRLSVPGPVPFLIGCASRPTTNAIPQLEERPSNQTPMTRRVT